MFVIFQSPIFDGRHFLDRMRECMVGPSWLNPQPGKQFVRDFGPVVRRRLGGHELWKDEMFYCHAHNAIKFNQTLENKKIIFRRLLSNGASVVRLQVGVRYHRSWLLEEADVSSFESRYIGSGALIRGFVESDILLLLYDFINLRTKITRMADRGLATSLGWSGDGVAKLFEEVTIKHSPTTDRSRLPSALVQAGSPMVLIEHSNREIKFYPRHTELVDPEKVGGAEMAYLWVNYKGREFGLWFLCRDGVDRKLARRLRIGLLRLHAEHWSMKCFLNSINNGHIPYPPRTETADRIDLYIKHATRILAKPKHGGFSPAAISDVLSAYDSTCGRDDRELLRERLKHVRRQIAAQIFKFVYVSGVGHEPQTLVVGTGPESTESGRFTGNFEVKNKIRVFYSYSHRDEPHRNRLEDHLTVLRRNGLIENWHDRKIGAGNDWQGTIDANLEAADVILLLVSSDFLASDYCYDVEMKRAMERHKQGSAKVIPVILRDCHWQAAPFGKLQALPTDGRAVTSWGNRDEAFTDIAKGICDQVQQMTIRS
jgi:hypothetical protein